MKLLFELDVKWLHRDITERSRHELWKYLREEMKIEEVTPESFARKVNEAFLSKQSDGWMSEFYAQLSSQKSLWVKGRIDYLDGILRKKPFIRLQDGRHVRPFDEDGHPNAYFPAETPDDHQLPTVKKEITNNEGACRFLLSDLKIPEFDLVAEVCEYVIRKYESLNPPDKEAHLHDLKMILQAFETDSHVKQERLKNSLSQTSFILSYPSGLADNENYRQPETLYFEDESLKMYFQGCPEVAFISSYYQDLDLRKDLFKMFENLGVKNEVRVTRKTRCRDGTVKIKDSHGCHKRGLNGFDPDIKVEGLSIALSSPTKEKSKFIWNKIAIPHADCIRGIVESSSRQNYESSEKDEYISEFFGRLLIDKEWLPSKEYQRFHTPDELKIEELPEGFERNENLANIFGMKKEGTAKLAEELGVSMDDIDKEDFEKWKSGMAARKEPPSFPTKPMPDPERREERLSEQLSTATGKEYVERERSVRTSNRTIDQYTWLRGQYTNESDQMVCQLCKDEMPFRKRDGQHYFAKRCGHSAGWWITTSCFSSTWKPAASS